MTRNLAGAIAFVAVVITGAVLAQTKPNFSGTWVAVSGAKEALGQEVWIKHDATSITIGHGGSVEHSQTFRLDGKEQTQADLAHPSETNTTQAMWDGDKIVLIVKLPNGTLHKRILTMQPDGTMLLEMIASVDGKPAETFKAVHKKK
jgi:hypothetical protein